MQALGANEKLILGNVATGHQGNELYQPYLDNTVLKLDSKVHTSVSFKHTAWETNTGPMICWRAHTVPPTLNNQVEHVGNVHYVCVRSWVVTDAMHEMYGEGPVRIAGALESCAARKHGAVCSFCHQCCCLQDCKRIVSLLRQCGHLRDLQAAFRCLF